MKNVNWRRAFRIIDKTLGIRLTHWQKRYIKRKSSHMPCKRRCGRTTAYMLRALLSAQEPLWLATSTVALFRLAEGDPSTPHPTNTSDEYKREFVREFRQMYASLAASKLNLPFGGGGG